MLVELARAEHGVDCVPLVVALLHGHGAVKGGERAAAAAAPLGACCCFDAPDVAREGGVHVVLVWRDVHASRMGMSALSELLLNDERAIVGVREHFGRRVHRGDLAAVQFGHALRVERGALALPCRLE